MNKKGGAWHRLPARHVSRGQPPVVPPPRPAGCAPPRGLHLSLLDPDTNFHCTQIHNTQARLTHDFFGIAASRKGSLVQRRDSKKVQTQTEMFETRNPMGESQRDEFETWKRT